MFAATAATWCVVLTKSWDKQAASDRPRPLFTNEPTSDVVISFTRDIFTFARTDILAFLLTAFLICFHDSEGSGALRSVIGIASPVPRSPSSQ